MPEPVSALLATFAQSKGLAPRPEPPSSVYTAFKPARALDEWVQDGQIEKGHEANGTVMRFEWIQAMNAALKLGGPCELLVIGERRFSDGRFFLDVGMNPDWIVENTDNRFIRGRWTPVCPDCEASGGTHRKVAIPDPASPAKLMKVDCPRAPARASRR